jgi:hypothetical protein
MTLAGKNSNIWRYFIAGVSGIGGDETIVTKLACLLLKGNIK